MRDDDKTTTTIIIPAAPGRYLGEFVGSPLKNLKRPRPLIFDPLSRWRSNSVEGRMPWPQLSHGQLSLGLSRRYVRFSSPPRARGGATRGGPTGIPLIKSLTISKR
jgi:hypothetical protein